MNEYNEYINRYILYGSDLNDCTTKEDVKKHNAAMKKLSVLYHEVEQLSDKSFLLSLLSNDNIRLRSLVAAHCLGLNVYTSEAKKVLKAIARSKDNPVVAFNAQATLYVWKKQGYLKF